MPALPLWLSPNTSSIIIRILTTNDFSNCTSHVSPILDEQVQQEIFDEQKSGNEQQVEIFLLTITKAYLTRNIERHKKGKETGDPKTIPRPLLAFAWVFWTL